MNQRTLLSLALCVVAFPLHTIAETWCGSAYPTDPPACRCSAIWCEDLDRICNGAPACPPAPPEPCTEDQGWSWALIRQAFPRTSRINDTGSLCGVEFKGEDGDDWVSSPPLATRFPKGQLGQATVDLRDDIAAKWGAGHDTVIGTDTVPLVLRFDMCGGTDETAQPPSTTNVHVQWDIGVMELFLDTGVPNANRSPMDYILVGIEEDPVSNPGCVSCYKTCPAGWTNLHNPWPHVCQSYEPRTAAPACPPPQTNVRTAIAIGANALLDNDPCHCQDPSTPNPVQAVPTNRHLSFYDGLKWRIINPDHPGPGGETLTWWTDHPSPTSKDYFVLGQKTNEITLMIKATTVEIHHRTRIKIDGQWQWVHSRVTGVSRMYLGAFNKLHGGASIGCRMNSSGACVGNRSCLATGYDTCNNTGKPEWGARWLSFDNLSLTGGAPDATPGACCLKGDDCFEMLPLACEAAGGHFAGAFSTCGESTCNGACCLPTGECTETRFDVCDGAFAGLGTDCATTQCPCPALFADADADLDVDQTDFGKLQACFTGPGPAPTPGVCRCFDRDNGGLGDGDVDTDDLEAFQACASGPEIPADPTCD